MCMHVCMHGNRSIITVVFDGLKMPAIFVNFTTLVGMVVH